MEPTSLEFTVQGATLEGKQYTFDSNLPRVVVADGFGGCASFHNAVAHLTKTCTVVTYSPRNAGNSNGHLNMNTYVEDLEYVLEDVSQKSGDLPYAFGHSMGGWALAKIMHEQKAKKAVLASPLIAITEQLPFPIKQWLHWYAGKEEVGPLVFGVMKRIVRTKKEEMYFWTQRLHRKKTPEFLESLFAVSPVEKELMVPTKVVLSGKSCLWLPVNTAHYAQKWKELGAEVSCYKGFNHWFGKKGYFDAVGAEKVLEEVSSFLC